MQITFLYFLQNKKVGGRNLTVCYIMLLPLCSTVFAFIFPKNFWWIILLEEPLDSGAVKLPGTNTAMWGKHG